MLIAKMKKILVIDDEPGYRDPLGSLLAEEGFDVRTAASRQEALKIAASFAPDILIVDWVLKNREDGLVVAEEFQAKNPRLRTIVITGYPTAGLEKRVEALACARCLTKPFRLSELIDAVREAAADMA